MAGYKINPDQCTKNFICSVCENILEDPWQTSEGNIMCYYCVDVRLFHDSDKMFMDKFTTREMGALLTSCTGAKDGEKCEWTGRLSDFGEHRKICKFIDVGSEISSLEKKLKGCKKTIREQEIEISKQKQIIGRHDDDIRHILETIDENTMNIARMISDKVQSHNVVRANPDGVTRNDVMEIIKDSSENIRREFDGFSNNIKMDFQDLDLRFQLSENEGYNGVCLWKIDNITERRQNAINGGPRALCSAPFYEGGKKSRKMSLRIYLNGDGMGRGTHLSLFLVIMKGEFDDTLSWPFHAKVKMTLINVAGDGTGDFVQEFTTPPDGLPYKKPTRVMNTASGQPMFIELDIGLGPSYCMNDSIYIRVEVEAKELPKS